MKHLRTSFLKQTSLYELPSNKLSSNELSSIELSSNELPPNSMLTFLMAALMRNMSTKHCYRSKLLEQKVVVFFCKKKRYSNLRTVIVIDLIISGIAVDKQNGVYLILEISKIKI